MDDVEENTRWNIAAGSCPFSRCFDSRELGAISLATYCVDGDGRSHVTTLLLPKWGVSSQFACKPSREE